MKAGNKWSRLHIYSFDVETQHTIIVNRLQNMRPITLLTFLTLTSASQLNSEIDPIYEIVSEGVKEIEHEQNLSTHIAHIHNDSLVHALLQKIKTTQTQNIYDMSLNALMVCKQIEMKTDSLANQIELAHTTDPNGQLNDKHNHELFGGIS